MHRTAALAAFTATAARGLPLRGAGLTLGLALGLLGGLAGCSTDFTIAKTEEIPPGADTGEAGEPGPEDTGTPAGDEGAADGGAGDSGTTEGTDTGGTDGGGTGGGTDGGGADGSGTDGGSTDGGGTDGGSGDGTTDEPPPADDCEGVADQIYVIDKDTEELYLFDPATLALTDVGELDCGSWSQPASMGVGRDGFAYVRYSDQSVYQVDLTTLACTATSYSDRSTGFGAFGMGYATDSATTWHDQLYIANSRQIATLDTSTMRVTAFATMPSQSELTGNADGELWAFLPLESPAELRRIDQFTGTVAETLRISGFPSPTDIDTFAFAAWGGELYAFVRVYGVGSSTDVYRVESSGRLTRVATRIGINVVGAGVSTCAPTDAP